VVVSVVAFVLVWACCAAAGRGWRTGISGFRRRDEVCGTGSAATPAPCSSGWRAGVRASGPRGLCAHPVVGRRRGS